MTVMTRPVALAAVLVLALGLTGCGPGGRGDRAGPMGPSQQQTADPGTDLDDLDALLDQVDQALAEAAATPADED
jgi:hypothetical protein